MLRDERDVGAVSGECGGLRPDTRRAREHGVHLSSGGQVPRRGQQLEGDLANGTAARFREDEDVRHQSTLASSLSNRTSSGTAAAPSPMIRPAWRSGGNSIFITDNRGATSFAGVASIGVL